MQSRTYGWRPDVPDKRDRVHRTTFDAAALPKRVDHSPQMPECYDQGSLGSCTAHAIGGAIAYELGDRAQLVGDYYVPSWFAPSFLQIYYCERALEGTTHDDAGAFIRDGAKVTAQIGVAPASAWPYDEAKFSKRPPKSVYRAALNTRVTSYMRVPQNVTDLRAELAAGDTVVFGFSVYESFESDDVALSGLVPLPAAHESMLGGHAVLLVGYDHERKLFKVRNSWGPSWGDGGYFWMPYDYVCDPELADDFWTLKTVTEST
jgi:C1A family cysteine protease